MVVVEPTILAAIFHFADAEVLGHKKCKYGACLS